MDDIDKPPSTSNIGANANAEHDGKQEPNAKGHSGTGLAGSTHGNLAAAAAAHLRRSGYSPESFGGGPEEIDRQAACLIRWARGKGLILPPDYIAGLFRHSSTTAEHQVFFRDSDNRAIKVTYPGTFGVTPDPKGVQRAATPLFYLVRLELMNRVFNSDLRLEGLLLGKSLLIGAAGEQASIVISQPWCRPANPLQPHPASQEVAQFMESVGFRAIARSYYGWQRKADGITILDAREDNYIKSVEGVVPIDLVIHQTPSRLIAITVVA